jgi:hypothetical protein
MAAHVMTEGRSPSAAVEAPPPAPREAPSEEPRLPSGSAPLAALCLRTTVSRGCSSPTAIVIDWRPLWHYLFAEQVCFWTLVMSCV